MGYEKKGLFEGIVEIPGESGIKVPRVYDGHVVSFALLEISCCSPGKKSFQVENKKRLFDKFFRKQERGEVYRVYTGVAHYSPGHQEQMNGLDFVLHYEDLNTKMFEDFSEEEVEDLCALIPGKKRQEIVCNLFNDNNSQGLLEVIQQPDIIKYSTAFRGTIGEMIVVKDITKNAPNEVFCYPRAEITLGVSLYLMQNGRRRRKYHGGKTEIDVIAIFYDDRQFLQFLEQLGSLENINLTLNGKFRS